MKTSCYTTSCNPNYDWLKVAMESVKGLFDEYILVDNASINPIPHADYRIEKNKGIWDGRNCGIEHAKYELITSIDDDDEMIRPNAQKLLSLVDENEADIYHFPCEMFGGRTGLWGNNPNISSLLDSNCIPASAWIKKSWWKKVGGYEGEVEDWNFWVKSYLNNARFYYFPLPVYRHRMRPDSYSADMVGEKLKRIRRETKLFIDNYRK